MSQVIIEAVAEQTRLLKLNNIVRTQDAVAIEKGQSLNVEEYGNHSRFADLKYKKYAPVWNRNDDYEEAEDFEHIDRGHFADHELPNLFPKDKKTQKYSGSVKVKSLTPKFGTEVRGVQLSELSDKGKDELALFVAQRGVVIFRNQDLKDKPVKFAEQFGRYFGVPQIHPTEPNVAGSPELFLVYSPKGEHIPYSINGIRNNSLFWHTDVSYEKQPAGTTFLAFLEGPTVGADTIYADAAQAYERLSPEFKKRLEGLKAVHSGHEQISYSLARGGITRRKGIANEHPVVRTHPVTKQKILYVNPTFTRSIVGYKKEESDFLLNFLYDQITKAGDIQVRANWEEGTVAVWDNRRVQHAATFDWDDQDVTRHLVRITPQAERPTESFDN